MVCLGPLAAVSICGSLWGFTPGPQGVVRLGPTLSGKPRVWQGPGGCRRAKASRQTWRLGGFPVPNAKGSSWARFELVCQTYESLQVATSLASPLIPKVLSFSGTTAMTYRLGRVWLLLGGGLVVFLHPRHLWPYGLPQPRASGEGRIWQSSVTGRLSPL